MLQKIIDYLYRYPKSAIKKYKRFGGYFNYRRMLQGENQMEKAAMLLLPVYSNPEGLTIYFLTGKNFIYQTLFCIQSLSKVSNVQFNFILVDDGSFDADLMSYVKQKLPQATIITTEIIDKNLDNKLPRNRFKNLRDKREHYPHLKKLTDIHTLPISGWKLVLDSDMLFWNCPIDIVAWLNNPACPIYMLDCQQSYGYTEQLMAELCGAAVPDLLNVGVIGLKSEDIDWEKLDGWIKILEEKEGSSYYLEQALTAMLIGSSAANVLNAAEYVVNPNPDSINKKTGILHHYVDLSKEGYFKNAWRKI